MIYTFKYIKITQEILNYIDKNNENNSFLHQYPVLGELWKLGKETLHVIEAYRGDNWMVLPKEIISVIEIKQIVNDVIGVTELMLGDFVYCSVYGDNPRRIVNLNLDYINNIGSVKFLGYDSEVNISTLQPIPITPIALELNDFSQTFSDKVNGEDFVIYMSKDKRVLINKLSNSIDDGWYCHIDNEDMETIGGADIQYIHELQHLYRLCNYNKPIFI